MKNLLLLPFLLAANFLTAQKAPYNVVIDVTSADTIVHKMVMRWVSEILKSDASANVEVVFYGKSIDMITHGKSIVEADLAKYNGSKQAAFRVCEVALKSNNIDKVQLVEGIGTVPDGIYEIVQKQHDGWAYIKAGR